MSLLLGPEPTAAPSSAAPVSPRRRWRRRTLWGLVAAVAVVAVSMTVTGSQRSKDFLDPDNPGRHGARAVAEVLREHGVDVEVVRGVDALESVPVDADTTVLVSSFRYLREGAGARVADHVSGAGRLVLVAPQDISLLDLGVAAEQVTSTDRDLTADCDSDIAGSGDRLAGGAMLYRAAGAAASGATACFRPDGAGSAPETSGSEPAGALLELPPAGDRPATVLVGSPAVLTNSTMTEASHAALSLRALGSHPRVVWYVPVITDAQVPVSDGTTPDTDRGVPAWFTPLVVLLALCLVAFSFARGRRLGRPVVEPLPVVVRAVETTEARGRLYRRARDTGRAATALRRGTLDRLTTRLGLPRHATPEAVTKALAHLTDRPAADIAAVLDGSIPQTDRDLLLLAQQLADLEESVRRA